jgi:hypothetical protein
VEVVSELLAAGADQHEANNFGELPLHAAAFTGMDAVLPVLLNALAPPQVDARTLRGRTPLHLAAAHDRAVRLTLSIPQSPSYPPELTHRTMHLPCSARWRSACPSHNCLAVLMGAGDNRAAGGGVRRRCGRT